MYIGMGKLVGSEAGAQEQDQQTSTSVSRVLRRHKHSLDSPSPSGEEKGGDHQRENDQHASKHASKRPRGRPRKKTPTVTGDSHKDSCRLHFLVGGSHDDEFSENESSSRVVEDTEELRSSVALLFTKTSSMWGLVESREVFQAIPQQPHFQPLKTCPEDFREGSALGMMISFANFYDRVRKLTLDHTEEDLRRKQEPLQYFMYHGFDVQPIRDCLEHLLKLKNDDQDVMEKKSALEAENLLLKNDAMQHDSEINKIDSLISDLLAKKNVLIELQKKCCTNMKEKDKEILQLNEAHVAIEREFNLVASLLVQDKQIKSSDFRKEVKSDQVGTSNSATIERVAIHTKKILLVLDVNGLLADITHTNQHTQSVKQVHGKSVFKRPFCDEFLDFCFSAFHVGVWSSRIRKNLEPIIGYIIGDKKRELLFCWDQTRCTDTGFKTPENTEKPLFLKELKKLWEKEDPELPWEDGKYSESNTLLIDDSPYKALLNPSHTAIFPDPYRYQDENDSSLGPGGNIRVYLEKLAVANDVRHYVRENPFGQQAITSSSQNWEFYSEIQKKIMKASSQNISFK